MHQRSAPSWAALTCANRQSLLQKKGKSKYNKKQTKIQKGRVTNSWWVARQDEKSLLQSEIKYLLLALFVAQNNGKKFVDIENLCFKPQVWSDGTGRYTYIGHVLQLCKIIVIAACYWSSWMFFIGFLRLCFSCKVPSPLYFYWSQQEQKQGTGATSSNKTNTQKLKRWSRKRRNHYKEETAALPATSNNSLREADSGRERGQARLESVTHLAQGKPEGRREWKELSTGWQGKWGEH